MARISKKLSGDYTAAKGGQAKKMYSVGIYARLSVNGNERKNESVETQVEIAKAFIGEHEDMVLVGCYTDIGKTGTDFAREGFERMMCDVRKRRIDCIVVKDLSRFGRNHIETGNYIEKIFPFLGVRFIAVTDNFDSMDLSGGNDIWGVNLKNLVNEMYAKDIGIKVKSAKKIRQEQGSYTGGKPPYGYRAQRVGDKRCLCAEEDCADVVRNIFGLFLGGRSINEIVAWLYVSSIATPMDYYRAGKLYYGENEQSRQWTKGTVKKILTNPVYTGCLPYGHSHEAIIGEEMFLKAAEKFKKMPEEHSKNKYPVKRTANVIDCRRCGSKSIYQERKLEEIVRFGCEQYIKYRKGEIDEKEFKHIKEENDKKLDALAGGKGGI